MTLCNICFGLNSGKNSRTQRVKSGSRNFGCSYSEQMSTRSTPFSNISIVPTALSVDLSTMAKRMKCFVFICFKPRGYVGLKLFYCAEAKVCIAFVAVEKCSCFRVTIAFQQVCGVLHSDKTQVKVLCIECWASGVWVGHSYIITPPFARL